MSNDSDIEEEIKEEIIIDNNDEDNDNKIQCTYDKFLLESVAFEGKQKRNETQNLLKANMKNIISEIKEKKYENQKSKNSMKKELFSNFLYNDFEDNVIEENENEDKEIVRKLIEEKKEKTMKNELQLNNEEDKIRNEPLYEESKENNMIYDNEIVNTKINQESNFNNMNNNNLINYNNEKLINNQNETVDNLILSQNQKNKINNNNNKKLNYIVNGDPSLQQKILDNYNYFQSERNNNGSNNHQKKINSLSKPKANNSNNNINFNNNYNNNTNEYIEQNPRVFIVDDCKTEEERKIIEQKRQKKLKTLEENIQKRRAKSKSKPEQNIIINSTNDTSITSLQLSKRNNNNPIKIKQNRPTTASINSNNKNIKNNNINNNTNKSNNKISPNNTKKRPLTSESNNISHISNIHDTTLSSNVSNISNFSNLSRVPIKIQREESIIANKKVKNVKYSKMSNKKVIIKAINKVCLAGIPNREYREKIIEIINKCTCENYIILFKGNYGSFNLRAVYTFDIENSNIELLTCINNAPNFIDSSMVTTYYKYNISQNQFKELSGNKEFSVIVDGVCIQN